MASPPRILLTEIVEKSATSKPTVVNYLSGRNVRRTSARAIEMALVELAESAPPEKADPS